MSVKLFAAESPVQPRPYRQSEVQRNIRVRGIYVNRVWTAAEWAVLPEEERPDEAFEHLNGVWTYMELLTPTP